MVQDEDGNYYGEIEDDEEEEEEGEEEEAYDEEPVAAIPAALPTYGMETQFVQPGHPGHTPQPHINAVSTKEEVCMPESAPTGYLPVTTSQGITAHALVDSGNLFGNLISTKLARRMQLDISGPTSRSQILNANCHVNILGSMVPFHMHLTGIPTPLLIQPRVAKNLAQDINLGLEFLCCHEASLDFHLEGACHTAVNTLGQSVRSKYFRV